ncbi:alpha/beta hydrolase family protein [Echinicola sp. 20G]|uniref:alpha/beta hydrolase n=1 Tax=Echinicola sp. 20G TaxID=2781961 RepID=UPI001910E0E1|nr:alpha/beta hydrolase family protein [Echinicola sp. 20G]
MKKISLIFSFVLAFSSLVLAKTDTIQVYSQKMEKTIPNLLFTPSDYDESLAYPTVYLLHGAGGNYTSWSGIADLQYFANLYSMIIVCPDAGVTSWYYDSPIDPKMQYETFVSSELVNWVDEHYSTKADRNYRGITGLSMGGHGGLYLGFRHQETFSVAGSTSGGVDILPFPLNWDIAKRLGSYAENKEVWEKNTVINMLHLLDGRSLDIIIDCGVHDFFYDANVRLHEKLEQRNIPHDFTARPGVHNGDYWKNSIAYQLLFMHSKFESRK